MSELSADSAFGDSVSQLLNQLKDGQEHAAQQIWSRYMHHLVAAAQKRLKNSSRRVVDEDDVASRAFEAFLRGVAEGRFSELKDRTDLWQILVMLVDRKAADQIRSIRAKKRGNGETRGDSVFYSASSESNVAGFDHISDPEPSQEFVIMFCEQFRALLLQIDDDLLEEIVYAKLQNYSNQEIAEKCGVSVSTVERKLKFIRELWQKLN